ncbi:MAG: hypothetical protein ACR2P1_02600 [Pseudomonadales bacterium]
MTNKITRFFLFASLSAMANHIIAQESGIDWVAGFAIGVKTIEFEEHRDGVVVERSNVIVPIDERSIFENDRDYDETLYYADLSLGAAFQNFYIAANVEIPFADTTYDESLVGTQTEDRIVNIVSTGSGDLSRFDYALTLGYNIWEGLAVFTGYKFGETELTFEKSVVTFPEGDPNAGADSIPRNFETTYEEKGYFVGANYAFNIADAGLLSLSVAYADLDAEHSESADFGEPSPSDSQAIFLVGPVSYDGDAEGFSYGIKWTGRLTDSLQYNIGLKYQKYELDGRGVRDIFENPNREPNPPPRTLRQRSNLKLDTTEEITTFTAGLAYIF